jgi:hypothetical protein
MAHHWSEMDPEAHARLADLVEQRNDQRQQLYDAFTKPPAPDELATLTKLGATGRFPDGKVTAGDEGEIVFNVIPDMEKRLVFVDFGKPVHLLGLTDAQAVELGTLLLEKARYVRK